MYEYLKPLFGANEDGTPVALTFDQLTEKLGASKEVKLANLESGEYVSAEKYKAKDTELKGVKQQLEAANSTIQSYKDMDIEGIKKSAADWEQKYKDDTAALNQTIADNKRAYDEDLFLRGYKFSSKAAEAGIRAEFAKRKFTYEDGKFLGAKEFMEDLQQSDDYKAAFVIEQPATPPEDGHQTPPPNYSSQQKQQTPPPKKKSLLELMKLKNDNPNAEISFD